LIRSHPAIGHNRLHRRASSSFIIFLKRHELS
jgi:hypothetical protein